jgi:hypothetical protein
VNVIAYEVEKLRPSAVESHVKQVAQRLGCSRVGTQRAKQAAARALRNGETAHRAIKAGVCVAADDAAILQRIRADTNEHKADCFWRDLLLDTLGFALACVLSVLVVACVWIFLGAP